MASAWRLALSVGGACRAAANLHAAKPYCLPGAVVFHHCSQHTKPFDPEVHPAILFALCTPKDCSQTPRNGKQPFIRARSGGEDTMRYLKSYRL